MHTLLSPAIRRPPPRRGASKPAVPARVAHAAASLLIAGLVLNSCAVPPPAAEQAAEEASIVVTEAKPFNIRDVFPEGPGRELVLANCQSCHVLVPILVLRMDEAAWYRSSIEHRERVEGLTDVEFEVLYDYLTTTFTPDRPIPSLPPALLDTWTTY